MRLGKLEIAILIRLPGIVKPFEITLANGHKETKNVIPAAALAEAVYGRTPSHSEYVSCFHAIKNLAKQELISIFYNAAKTGKTVRRQLIVSYEGHYLK